MRISHFLILLFCLIKTTNVFCSQNEIDSLKNLLTNELNNDSDISTVGNINQKIGNLLKLNGEFIMSNQYYLKALNIFNNNQNFRKSSDVYRNIGINYKQLGDYSNALKYYFESLKIAEKIKYGEGTAAGYQNIGNVFYYMGDITKSFDFYTTALQLYKADNDFQGIADITVWLGNICLSHKDYQCALSKYFAASQMYDSLNDLEGRALCLNNIAGVFTTQKEFNKALEEYYNAYTIHNRVNNKNWMAMELYNISETYYLMGNYKKASDYADSSIAIAGIIQDNKTLLSAYNLLAVIFDSLHLYKKANEYYRLHSAVKDTMLNNESIKQIAEMQTKYETEKKDKEIESKQKELEIKQLLINERNYQLIGITALLLLMAIIAFLVIYQNKLRSAQKTLSFEQKLLRLQMNPHFIFNALISIQTVISNNNELSIAYLSRFSELMRLILEFSKEEYIPLEKEITIITHYLELQKLRFQDKFNYRLEISEQLDTELTQIPPMLCQPFIENALEHGIRHKDGKGEIIIRFCTHDNMPADTEPEQRQSGLLLIEIEDNGIGISKTAGISTKQHKSLATAITVERLKNLNKRKKRKIVMNISDLCNNTGKTGTKIIFNIPIS